MNKKTMIVVISILLAVVAVSGCIGNSNSNTGSSSASGYQVKIIYSGPWQGAISADGNTTTHSGTGDEIINLGDVKSGIVSANAVKKDNNSEKLTIQILKDGKVVEEAYATVAYELAQVVTS